MRAYPWLIATIVVVIGLLMCLISRMKELEDWERDHKYETGMTYKQSHVR
jgi:hypothetical protein